MKRCARGIPKISQSVERACCRMRCLSGPLYHCSVWLLALADPQMSVRLATLQMKMRIGALREFHFRIIIEYGKLRAPCMNDRIPGGLYILARSPISETHTLLQQNVEQKCSAKTPIRAANAEPGKHRCSRENHRLPAVQ